METAEQNETVIGSSSDSEEDYYENLVSIKSKELNNARKRTSNAGSLNSIPYKQAPKSDTSDSDDDLMDLDEMNLPSHERLRRRAEKARIEERKKHEMQLEDIKKIAILPESFAGQKPSSFFCSPDIEAAEDFLKEMAERSKAMEATTVEDDVSFKEEDVQEDFELRNQQTVHFLVSDLEQPGPHNNNHSLDMYVPFKVFRQIYATKWDCDPQEVYIRIDSMDIENCEDDQTPAMLDIPPDTLTLVSVYRVIPLNSKNLNEISVKCQLESLKRPAVIVLNKKHTFAEIKAQIKETLKLEKISAIYFDNEVVSDDVTPLDLDMEDEDCLDIHP